MDPRLPVSPDPGSVSPPLDVEATAFDDAVARARLGDPRAYDRIATTLAPALTRYAKTVLCGDATAADDVVQDALVAGWRALPTLRAPHRLRGWLFSVTHRKAMSWLRYRGIRRSDPLVDDVDGPCAPASPHPASAEAEAHADLHRALAGIPVRYVAPLTLCYLEGLGLHETARVLALAPNTLKMRLHRGRTLLRARLARLEGWRPHRRRATGAATARVATSPAPDAGARSTCPADARRPDPHPADPYPADPHLADAHPADTHPAETHPAETHPAETHPADTHPADTGAADAHAADAHPAVPYPAVPHPADAFALNARLPDEPRSST